MHLQPIAYSIQFRSQENIALDLISIQSPRQRNCFLLPPVPMKSLAAFQHCSTPLPLAYSLRRRRAGGAVRRGAAILQNWKADVEQDTTIYNDNDDTDNTTRRMPPKKNFADVEALEDPESLAILSSTTSSTNEPQWMERKSAANHPNQNNGSTDDDDNVATPSSGPSPIILGMPPRAILALNAVAIIFGTQHAVIKLVVDDSDAGCFTFLRFGIGALLASAPLLFMKKQTTAGKETSLEATDSLALLDNNNNNAQGDEKSSPSITTADTASNNSQNSIVWRWGAEMGFWMFLGFAFQAIGLATTTAQRSGFLLYLNVKFVPFFAFVLLGRQISLSTWLSALTAFAGTALLAYDGTSWSINQGDLWSIAAAAASAMYILRLDVAANAVGDNNSVRLNAACLWIVTLLSGIWSLLGTSAQDPSQFVHQLTDIVTHHPWEVFYLSAVTTALANFIQTKSQKEVSAERASVIYAMDPVYGAFFSNLILGESLTSLGFVGAGMITAAAATNALLDLGADSASSSSTMSGTGDSGRPQQLEQDENENDANKHKSQ